MDREDLDLENELKALRPSTPPARLWVALQRELEGAPPASRDRKDSILPFDVSRWLGWGAAAAFLVTILTVGVANRSLGTHDTRSAAQSPGPIDSRTVVLATREEGLVTLPDGTTARRYRIQAVDTFTWKPGNQATLEWRVPREDVRLVPVTTF